MSSKIIIIDTNEQKINVQGKGLVIACTNFSVREELADEDFAKVCCENCSGEGCWFSVKEGNDRPVKIYNGFYWNSVTGKSESIATGDVIKIIDVKFDNHRKSLKT